MRLIYRKYQANILELELTYLTTTPTSQVNDRFGKGELLLYTLFIYRHTKGCLSASYRSIVANEESIPLALLRTL